MYGQLKLFVLCIILTITGLLTYKYTQTRVHINDSEEYINYSHNIVNYNTAYAGNFYSPKDFRLFAKRTPGYPAYIIMQWSTPATIYLSQALLVLFLYFLGFALVKKWKNKCSVFYIYSVGFALQVTLFLHVGFIMSDLLLAATLTLGTLVFYSQSKDKVKLLSILWLLAVLIKPVMLPSLVLIPILFVWLILKSKKIHLSLWLPVVTVVCISWVNFQQTHKFEYSSISTINMAHYNAKLTIASAYGYDSAQQFSSAICSKIPSNQTEYNTYISRAKEEGVSTILNHLPTYAKIHTLGAIKMLFDPGRFELYTFFNQPTSSVSLTEKIYAGDWCGLFENLKKGGLLLVALFLFGLVQFLKVMGSVFAIKDMRKHYFLMLLFVYFVGLSGPIGAARFFVPISVLFTVFSAIGWSIILEFFQKRTKRK